MIACDIFHCSLTTEDDMNQPNLQTTAINIIINIIIINAKTSFKDS